MIRILKPLKVEEALREKNIRLFSSDEFRRLFGVSEYAAQNFIKNHTKDLFIKLRNGLYASRLNPPSEMEIANRLLAPSYISFEYALAYYNILPEMTYSVTSATSKPTRLFTTREKAFAYYTIKNQAYTGYVLVKSDVKNFLIAEPEKALADYLYYVAIGHKRMNSRLTTSSIDTDKLRAYASLFQRNTLLKLTETI